MAATLALMQGILGGASPTLALLATALGGFACSVVTLIWGETSRRRETRVLAIATMISLTLTTLILLLLFYLLDTAGALFMGLASLLPLVSVILMYKAQHDNESYLKPQEFVISKSGVNVAKEGRAWVETTHELRISKRGFALRLGKSALLFGIVFGIVLGEAIHQLMISGSGLIALLPETALPLLGACLFIFLMFVAPQEERPSGVQRVLPCFLAFLLLSASTATAVLGMLAALIFLALVLFWMYPAEITQRYRITPMITFGFFAGFFAIGMLAWLAVETFATPADAPWQLLAALSAVLYLIGCLTLITDQQMRAISIIGPITPQTAKDARENGRDEKPHMPFRERCQLVADTFLLSHRELEILYLLAKGRNAASIQRELVISEGTVRTHMRNIYHKLNVHSQQELIDLVENIGRTPTK